MIAGRYRLEREIGRGRSTSVWAGHDTLLDRRVALKRLGFSPGSDEVDAARAEREARLAARVHHPHVVSVYDLADDGDFTWLVMELVDGPTLADLSQHGPVDLERAARLLAQVADALAAAHADELVHRDVKPSNVFVTGDDVAKLGDFGIARREDDEALTRTGLITGSPAYLSPEIARGSTATAAGDVWAFGITVYRVVTGSAPYDVEGDDVVTAVQKILDAPAPALPADHPLAPVVAAATRHDPTDRATMRELADLLQTLAQPSGLGHHRSALADLAVARAATAGATESTATIPAVDVHRTAVTQAPPPRDAVTPPPTLPPPTSRRGGRRRRDRRTILVAAAALVAFGAAGAGVLATTGEDRAPVAAAASAAPPLTAQQRLEKFATDYVRTAASDPQRGFQLLTASYQQASGGITGYTDFWGRVSDVRVEAVRSDPDQMRVTYTYSYEIGGVRRTQALTLLLTQEGDRYLIRGALAA